MTWKLEAEVPLGSALRIARHRLENGLGAIIISDHSAPIASVQTWYRVGSRHEAPGHTGMAHLFEHLMFNRTSSLPTGEFDRIIERAGGDSNAATWVDWTYYRDSVPSTLVSKMLEIEADRMTGLILDGDVLESEREVVANERLQRVDEDPDGKAAEELFRLAFESHPYHWPTIGWMQDIRAIDLESVLDFYRRYYSPNNATIVVVGDIEEERALELIASRFAAIPAAEIPVESFSPEPPQSGERRKRLVEPVSSPRLVCGYKAPAMGSEDWTRLFFLSAALAGGESSRLYKELVIQKEWASSVSVDIMPFRDPSLMEFSVCCTRDADPSEVLKTIEGAIARIVADGLPDAEVEKVRNLVETEFWSELLAADGKAEILGQYESTLGDFRSLFDLAEALSQMGGGDLAAAAGEHLVTDRRTIIEVLPGDDS